MRKDISSKPCAHFIIILILFFVACTKLTDGPGTLMKSDTTKTTSAFYPHSKEFKTTSLHGETFLSNRESCVVCHGTDLSGGRAQISCQKCHSYPHSPKWVLPQNHGAAYIASLPPSGEDVENPSLCLDCHNEKNALHEKRPDVFVSCGSCHLPIPHNLQFKIGEGHAPYAKNYDGECTLCHTNLKRLLPHTNEKGCFSCHKTEIGKTPVIRWRAP